MQKKKFPVREKCGNCIPIGEGNHLRDTCQEIVLSEYAPIEKYMYCGGREYTED